MQWEIEDNAVAQIGGNGSDYAAWIVGREGDEHQHVVVQVGQCGDAPEGDKRAREIVLAMVNGLNAM